MNSLFCRHNRFTADCPICSRGTVLDSRRSEPRPRAAPSGRTTTKRAPASAASGARSVVGPYATAGPYARDEGSYEVRLERVPGGVRLAQWSGGALERRAPVLPAQDLRSLVAGARERGVLATADLDRLEAAVAESPAGDAVAAPGRFGASAGRAGELREELRVEALGDGLVRVGRWIYRPNAGWELQQSPPMLPAKRYAEALRAAAAGGVLVPMQ